MSVLVNSKNIFLSTQASGNLGGGSDDSFHRFRMCLNDVPLQTGNGQYAKLTLVDFNMYRNFMLVNKFNNRFVMSYKYNGGAIAPVVITLETKDYADVGAIAAEFQSIVMTQLNITINAAAGNPLAAGAVSPALGFEKGDTGTGIINLTLTSPAGNHLITDIVIQAQNYYDATTLDNNGASLSFGSSYALLGAKRVSEANAATNSFTTTAATNTITIAGFYPMQRSTNSYLYLRCLESNRNMESENFKGAMNLQNDTHIVSSTILAKIPIQNEMVSFAGDLDNPYFYMTDTRNISEILFAITDEHNRRIDTIDDQELLGNMFCELTLNYSVFTKGISQPVNNNVEQNIIGVIQRQGIS